MSSLYAMSRGNETKYIDKAVYQYHTYNYALQLISVKHNTPRGPQKACR